MFVGPRRAFKSISALVYPSVSRLRRYVAAGPFACPVAVPLPVQLPSLDWSAAIVIAGKSFLLNQLMGRMSGFELGSTVNPTTEVRRDIMSPLLKYSVVYARIVTVLVARLLTLMTDLAAAELRLRGSGLGVLRQLPRMACTVSVLQLKPQLQPQRARQPASPPFPSRNMASHSHSPPAVIFLDTEGLAAPGNDADYDAKIFALATLLSSHLV